MNNKFIYPTYNIWKKCVLSYKIPSYYDIFCRKAIITALKSEEKFKVGAILLKNRKIIDCKANHGSKFPGHAEFRVMKNNDGDCLIVARVLKNGLVTDSCPCDFCISFAKEKGIRKILGVEEDRWVLISL